MTEKTYDPLNPRGLFAPRVTIEHQGAYHLTSMYVRAGSRFRGFYSVEFDSKEKRLEVNSYSRTSWNDSHYNEDEIPGSISLYVGARGVGDSTIFYADEGFEDELVDAGDWSLVNIQFPRPFTSYIPRRVRKALRIPSYDWEFSVNQFYDKYGFTLTAWLEKSYIG